MGSASKPSERHEGRQAALERDEGARELDGVGEARDRDGKPPHSGSRQTLVVADPERWVHRAIAASLPPDFDVVPCTTSRAALNACCALEPSCVVVELELDEPGGLWLVTALRAQPSLIATAPIVMVARRDDEATRLVALRSGVDAFVAKPFATIELAAQIRAFTAMAARVRAGSTRESFLPPDSERRRAIVGALDRISITTVLSALELERRSGDLCLSAPRSSRHLVLNLAGGVLVGGWAGRIALSPIEAIRHALAWGVGRFEFHPSQERRPGSTVEGDVGIGGLVLRAMREASLVEGDVTAAIRRSAPPPRLESDGPGAPEQGSVRPTSSAPLEGVLASPPLPRLTPPPLPRVTPPPMPGVTPPPMSAPRAWIHTGRHPSVETGSARRPSVERRPSIPPIPRVDPPASPVPPAPIHGELPPAMPPPMARTRVAPGGRPLPRVTPPPMPRVAQPPAESASTSRPVTARVTPPPLPKVTPPPLPKVTPPPLPAGHRAPLPRVTPPPMPAQRPVPAADAGPSVRPASAPAPAPHPSGRSGTRPRVTPNPAARPFAGLGRIVESVVPGPRPDPRAEPVDEVAARKLRRG